MICGFLLLVISSCSYCSKDALHETKCCGRAYCGQECLEADLVEHDLECVEFSLKLPQWLKRSGQGDVQELKRPQGQPHKFIAGYKSKTKRDKVLRQFQTNGNEKQLYDRADFSRRMDLGDDYQKRISTTLQKMYWIVY